MCCVPAIKARRYCAARREGLLGIFSVFSSLFSFFFIRSSSSSSSTTALGFWLALPSLLGVLTWVLFGSLGVGTFLFKLPPIVARNARRVLDHCSQNSLLYTSTVRNFSDLLCLLLALRIPLDLLILTNAFFCTLFVVFIPRYLLIFLGCCWALMAQSGALSQQLVPYCKLSGRTLARRFAAGEHHKESRLVCGVLSGEHPLLRYSVYMYMYHRAPRAHGIDHKCLGNRLWNRERSVRIHGD